MKSISLKSLSILLITIIFGCSSEKELAKTIPQVTTTSASNITLTNASTGGNVSQDGGAPVTSRGVFWNNATAPTISLATKTTDGSGTGSFSSSIANLNPSTNYYVRAYATNSVGTGYGNEITFTTGAIVLPTLTTAAVTIITSSSAVAGGTISTDGGGSITSRGVVWGTSISPTINLSTKTTDGTGMGNFISNIINLLPTTKYFIRAYATNSAGTGYGNEVSFTTTVAPIESIVIGNQTWSKKNTEIITYRDGTPIPQVTNMNDLYSLSTGAWCYYNMDSSNGTIYGKLYNGYAILGIHTDESRNTPSLRKEFAPTGWHVPSLSDWTTLSSYLGGELIAGGKMKEIGTSHWDSPNTDATNSSGFTGLGSGIIAHEALANSYNTAGIKNVSYFWSSTDGGSTLQGTKLLYRFYISNSSGAGNINKNGRGSFFSVRLIKD
jgi:uncharacterized protein (TIGR02145 family)